MAEVQIMRSSLSGGVPMHIDTEECIRKLVEALANPESEVIQDIERMLERIDKPRDRSACDAAFGYFSACILRPYCSNGMASRAAEFGMSVVIPRTLALEKTKGLEFHKGAIFYNVGLACLIAGDEDRFEYCLAMADEEDHLTANAEGHSHSRGTTNLKSGTLSKQTIQLRLAFLADMLSKGLGASVVNYDQLFGHPATKGRVDVWRTSLEPLHHGELFRALAEVSIFSGHSMPDYPNALDNPYVMLRLAKALAHLAQFAESYLTKINELTAGKYTLSEKLAALSNMVAAAPSKDRFCRQCPSGAAVNTELVTLLSKISLETSYEQKAWRILRVLYIIRNATAHVIEPVLDLYTDRPKLLELLQVVLLSVFVISKESGKTIP